MSNIEYFLQNSGLSEDLKAAFREAWEEKVTQNKKEAEEKVRKELSERYEVDRNRLVQSMEKFLVENLQKEIEQLNAEKKKLYEDQNNIKKSLIEEAKNMLEEAKKQRKELMLKKEKMKESLKKAHKKINEEYAAKMEKFISFAETKLKEEIKELRDDLKSIEEEKVKMQQQLRETRNEYKKVYEERLNKIEKFLLNQLAEELTEFNRDKKLLESRRVELEKNAAKKINETRRMFVEKATKLIDLVVSEEMTKELKQLKEDIKLAKQNDFGRRIFEAFVSEYMSSHLMEGSEISALKKKLDETQKTINDLKTQLNESRENLKNSKRETLMLKEELRREKTLHELLSPLSPKQRKLMVNLLEGVKTDNLVEQFKRYLPNVIDEVPVINKKSPAKEVISESVEHTSEVITGDRQTNINKEVTTENKEQDNTIIQIKKLAGINY